MFDRAAAQPSDPAYFVEMLKLLGTRELPGNLSNPVILAMLASVGITNPNTDDSSTAWCSASLNYAMKLAGFPAPGNAAARSWLKWGGKVELEQARRGDVVVLSRPGAAAWQGHVGLFVSREAGSMTLLGGNQNNAVSFAPYSVSRVLGVRRIKEAGSTTKKIA